jgi:hypothetical protein
VNTHKRLRYFLTHKIFLLQVMNRYVSMIFIVNCVTVTRFFHCLCSALMEKRDFYCLSSLETVNDTVQYRYRTFSLLSRLLRIWLKRQNPLLYTYERDRNYTVTVQYSAEYTLLLLLLLLFSRLYNPSGFRPAQLPLSILSRKVLQSAVSSGTSNPQLRGEPGI